MPHMAHAVDTEMLDGFVVVSKEDFLDESPDAHQPTRVPELLDDISRSVDDAAEAFWPVNRTIHDNPELAYKEFIAHDVLTRFMASRDGWAVTRSAYGMKTAWVAVFDGGKGGAVVSFNAEMDCLPGIGHACGHNLIASASVLGAVAAAEVMKKRNLGGKVVLFGTPAEEGGGGKIRLLEAGAYSDHKVDISLISHPGTLPDAARMRTTAYSQFRAEYFGREAHAAANPWLGINALDALVSAYNNVSMLRQQNMPGDIVQGHITDGGLVPNIIHAYAAGRFVVRADSQARLEELRKKVYACFEAGAQATGARLTLTRGQACKDHVANDALARSYTRYFNALDPPHGIAESASADAARGKTQASTDQGDISHAMPSLSPTFAIRAGPLGQGPHNPEFAEAAGTRDAYGRAARVAKGLAGVALDVLRSGAFLDEVKKSWRDGLAGDA
ncbi:Peptidase M20 domain-containing protein 2 [Tolypocladium ophioglossoides CBS 100239]|uniref:Peptidase M20 domain-containing protein 2 n=1 Tax=Tolypocladium ophioglossoides (strain CBS 100239) TaxID=1163406 RepID=A0A0L0NLL2_TOLOC|nr:Peptidase M20 domain-containing protein 2 [Tolypocladium ophioglossoides CBS 100239]